MDYHISTYHGTTNGNKSFTLTSKGQSYDELVKTNKGTVMSRGNIKKMLRDFISKNMNIIED